MEYPSLFKYWAKEILQAFKDISQRCSFEMAEEIEARNIYIADVGIKVFFKNEVYGAPKRKGCMNQVYYEALLLRNFAKLLTEILTKGSKELAELDSIP